MTILGSSISLKLHLLMKLESSFTIVTCLWYRPLVIPYACACKPQLCTCQVEVCIGSLKGAELFIKLFLFQPRFQTTSGHNAWCLLLAVSHLTIVSVNPPPFKGSYTHAFLQSICSSWPLKMYHVLWPVL